MVCKRDIALKAVKDYQDAVAHFGRSTKNKWARLWGISIETFNKYLLEMKKNG